MKKVSLILSALVLFVMMSGTVFAGEKKVVKLESLEATVVSVDAKTGKLEITTENNVKETLKAHAALLKGITAGEKVMIQKSGKVLKSIKKVAAVAPAEAK